MEDPLCNVNVSGKLYQIRRSKLLLIPYFASYFTEGSSWENCGEIFVERSSMLFDEVLAYVLDKKHPFPAKYSYELDFYDITYDKDSLYQGKYDAQLAKIQYELKEFKEAKIQANALPTAQVYKPNSSYGVYSNYKPPLISTCPLCPSPSFRHSEFCESHYYTQNGKNARYKPW